MSENVSQIHSNRESRSDLGRYLLADKLSFLISIAITGQFVANSNIGVLSSICACNIKKAKTITTNLKFGQTLCCFTHSPIYLLIRSVWKINRKVIVQRIKQIKIRLFVNFGFCLRNCFQKVSRIISELRFPDKIGFYQSINHIFFYLKFENEFKKKINLIPPNED